MALEPPDDSTPKARPRERTIEELMGRLADGDAEALGHVYDEVAPRLGKYLATRIELDRVDDTVREIILEIYRARSSYVPGTDVMTWAFTFAQYMIKQQGAPKSKIDEDVFDLLRSGIHTKEVAKILDLPKATVLMLAQRSRRDFEDKLEAAGASGTAPRPKHGGSARASDLVGTALAKYRIEEHIGSGGFGHVYRATRVQLGDEVAIKVMRELPGEDQGAVDEFKLEARLMAGIGNHPNIVRVLDVDELPDGRAYYAMDLLRGRSLAELVGPGKPFAWPRVAQLVAQLCNALFAVHKQGIVHGDIKPANCFVVDDGPDGEVVKLLDFGIAKPTAAVDPLRVIAPLGPIAGTEHYLAPELLDHRPPDERADIYAVGVMMFEMLTGESPFVAQHSMGLVLEKGMPTRSLAAAAPSLHFTREMEGIVRRALHHDPAERFASAAALGVAIAALGPSGRGRMPLSALGRDTRVRMVATASFSALLASVGTAALVTDSSAASAAVVPELTHAHVESTMAHARERIDGCRATNGGALEPTTATLRVLGETGEVINIEALVEAGESPTHDCVRKVLWSLRFPRFAGPRGDHVVEVEL